MPSSSSTIRMRSLIQAAGGTRVPPPDPLLCGPCLGIEWNNSIGPAEPGLPTASVAGDRSLELYHLAGVQEHYVFCHVDHPVADSLQVVGDVDQRHRPQRVLGVGAAAHVFDQIVEQPVVEAV